MDNLILYLAVAVVVEVVSIAFIFLGVVLMAVEKHEAVSLLGAVLGIIGWIGAWLFGFVIPVLIVILILNVLGLVG